MPEQGKHKDMHTRRNGLVAVTEQACLLNTKKAICSSLNLAAHEATLTCPEVLSSWSLRRWTMQIVMYRIRCKSGLIVERTRLNRGGSRIFFRRGCTRLLLYFNTNKPHSFFFCRIPVVFENRRSPQGRVRTPCTLPLDPPRLTFQKVDPKVKIRYPRSY